MGTFIWLIDWLWFLALGFVVTLLLFGLGLTLGLCALATAYESWHQWEAEGNPGLVEEQEEGQM